VVVKRYLYASDYADETSLEAAVQDMLKQCASVYLMACQEWGGK